MFSRKTVFIAALALFVPLASLIGGILLGQVANERPPVYPTFSSAESPGGRLLTPASEAMPAPQPSTYESPAGLAPANGSQIAKMPPRLTASEPDHATAASQSNSWRVVPQYGSSSSGYMSSTSALPPPLEPMTESEIDEALAGPLPTESHDEWLAKIERADKWLEHETKIAVADYHAADTNERRLSAKAEIKALSELHFDIRHKSRDLEVLKLEERLREIRAAIAKRNESKDLIVQVRLSVLLGEIEWDDWALPRKSDDLAEVGSEAASPATFGQPTSPNYSYPSANSATYTQQRSTAASSGYTSPAYAPGASRAASSGYRSSTSAGSATPLPSSRTMDDTLAVPKASPDRFSKPVAESASDIGAPGNPPSSDIPPPIRRLPDSVGAPLEEASGDSAIDSEPAETGDAVEETTAEEDQASGLPAGANSR